MGRAQSMPREDLKTPSFLILADFETPEKLKVKASKVVNC